VPRRRNEPPRSAPRHQRKLLNVCGLAAVGALFARDAARVERLFFEPRLAAALTGPRHAMARARKPYREVAADELARIAGTVRHGGVVAVAQPQSLLPLDRTEIAGWARAEPLLLVLDGIANPHNLGAVARSAAFFGVKRLILADRPDQALPSDAAYRVAEGGLEALTLHRAALPATLRSLKPAFRVLGTSPERGIPLAAVTRGVPTALVLGNEENGLNPRSLRECDEVVAIRGVGTVQSLNVAAAAAVLIYELTRG